MIFQGPEDEGSNPLDTSQIYSISVMNEDFSYLSSELVLVRKDDNKELMSIIDKVQKEKDETKQ